MSVVNSGYGVITDIISGILAYPNPELISISGIIYSGSTSSYYAIRCALCDKPLRYPIQHVHIVSTSGGATEVSEYRCWQCAGYNDRSGGFDWQKEYWIRQSVPLDPSTPAWMIADWLEDNNKLTAAEYMRSLITNGG